MKAPEFCEMTICDDLTHPSPHTYPRLEAGLCWAELIWPGWSGLGRKWQGRAGQSRAGVVLLGGAVLGWALLVWT